MAIKLQQSKWNKLSIKKNYDYPSTVFKHFISATDDLSPAFYKWKSMWKNFELCLIKQIPIYLTQCYIVITITQQDMRIDHNRYCTNEQILEQCTYLDICIALFRALKMLHNANKTICLKNIPHDNLVSHPTNPSTHPSSPPFRLLIHHPINPSNYAHFSNPFIHQSILLSAHLFTYHLIRSSINRLPHCTYSLPISHRCSLPASKSQPRHPTTHKLTKNSFSQ